MNSPPYYPEQSVLESSRRILEQACPPSVRDILGAYKFSKGQDGDCQLLIAVLNAKTAEDQRLAAVAKLHTTMLQYEQGIPPSPTSPHSHPSSPRSQYLSHFEYSRPEGEYPERKPRHTSRSQRHRTPYERPSPLESHARMPPSPHSSRSSVSSTSSPRSKAMSIGTLLSDGSQR